MFGAPWLPFGPDGGDARRFALDPHDPAHIYLGTANGWLYESHNGGTNWARLSRLAKRDDLVLDGIFVDPTDAKHLVVGAWVLGSRDGGIFITTDGGHTWLEQAEMRGQAILSLTSAPSDPKILVAGTLRGVYRSTDGGQRWKQISPPDSTEIHNVQSVAIDPKDPSVIYAGTWHLPWKTTDAGENWANIKEGIIEDSDVFSIIVDPDAPQVVYASACSGIYKSEDAGEKFRKVQGIPSSARRTRVLLQDPKNLATVFAGTTEGLFRSEDAGKGWNRTTDPGVIVNDVFVDRTDSKHVLLATDRGGILSSEDGGDTFHASNNGFSARQITAMKRDSAHPATLYVGVVNDKEYGGIFQSDNGGVNWTQRSNGLDGRDVFSLGQAPDGTMIAGTAHGVFRLDTSAGIWSRVENAPTGLPDESAQTSVLEARPPVPVVRNEFTKRTGQPNSSAVSPKQRFTPAQAARSRMTSTGKRPTAARRPMTAKSSAKRPVAQTKAQMLAAKKRGTPVRPGMRSVQQQPVKRKPAPTVLTHVATVVAPAAPAAPKSFDGSVSSLVTSENVVLATTSAGLLMSSDNGMNWQLAGPAGSEDWRYLAAAKSNVVAATLRTMHFSSDSGATWISVPVPHELSQIAAIAVEPSGEMWVGGREGVYVSSNGGIAWTTPKNLFVNTVTSIYYDDASNRVLVTASGANNVAFFVQLPTKTVTYADTGWNLRFVRPVGDHLVGATFFDGIVIQPKMVNMPAASETASR